MAYRHNMFNIVFYGSNASCVVFCWPDLFVANSPAHLSTAGKSQDYLGAATKRLHTIWKNDNFVCLHNSIELCACASCREGLACRGRGSDCFSRSVQLSSKLCEMFQVGQIAEISRSAAVCISRCELCCKRSGTL